MSPGSLAESLVFIWAWEVILATCSDSRLRTCCLTSGRSEVKSIAKAPAGSQTDATFSNEGADRLRRTTSCDALRAAIDSAISTSENSVAR